MRIAQVPPEAADATVAPVDLSALMEYRLGFHDFQAGSSISGQPSKALSMDWPVLPEINSQLREYRLPQKFPIRKRDNGPAIRMSADPMPSIRSLLLSSLLLPLPALAQQETPVPEVDVAAISRIDMAALIECRLDHDEFRAILPVLAQPLKAVSLGWQPLPRTNMFMSEYRLTRPITVFNHRTDHIALSGDVAIAILDLPDPRVLARELDLEEGIDTPEKVMLGKEVRSEDVIDPATGARTGIIASAVLTVSNVASHPGKTLVGCSYSRYREEAETEDGAAAVEAEAPIRETPPPASDPD